MWDIVLQNLINTGIGMGIFIFAYSSNMCFSLFYNVKMLNQEFDKQKLMDSGFKILAFGLGATLLVISVTTLPLFADRVGYEIPAEYKELLSSVAILAVFIISTCKYAIEAGTKMKLILSSKKVVENTTK